MSGMVEIDKFTPEERLQLISDLWDSFVHKPDSLPVRTEEKQELERRSHQHRLNPESALSEEEFYKRLKKRLGRRK